MYKKIAPFFGVIFEMHGSEYCRHDEEKKSPLAFEWCTILLNMKTAKKKPPVLREHGPVLSTYSLDHTLTQG